MKDIYCYNCDAQALWFVAWGNEHKTYFCGTCIEPFLLGQTAPDAGIEEVEEDDAFDVESA